jgi:thiamine-monophosphate kinase
MSLKELCMPINKKYPCAEYSLLEKLKPLLNHKPNSRYGDGIGDDAAIRISTLGEMLIITADTLVENVHFSLEYMTLAQAAYKAMAANLSDCAAMGAVPDGAMIQIVFPGREKAIEESILRLYKGFNSACKKWNFPIIGGNLSKGSEWIFDITLIGRIPKGSRPLKRTGIKNNDVLWVTGMPGMSRAGLDILQKKQLTGIPLSYKTLVNKHIAPVPRISTGLALALCKEIHAAIDVSDGISKEANVLSYDNNLKLYLDPVDKFKNNLMLKAAAFCNKKTWYEWFLNGGEDYELLFAADPLFDPNSLCLKSGVTCRRIGCFRGRGYGVYLLDEKQNCKPVACGGWEHL